MQREHGVDLRCGVTVTALEGERRPAARAPSCPTAPRSTSTWRWSRSAASATSSGCAARAWRPGRGGSACDAGCRAFDVNGLVTDDVFVAGDVARSPHPLFGYQFLALEHWGNAVAQAEVAAHNMISDEADRWPHLQRAVVLVHPVRRQHQVGRRADASPTRSSITQGSTDDRRFVAVYGYKGRVVAAVTFDQARWLEFYERLIEQAAPFPPDLPHRRPGRRARRPGPAPILPRPPPCADRTRPSRRSCSTGHCADRDCDVRSARRPRRQPHDRDRRCWTRSSPTRTAPTRTRSTPSCARPRSPARPTARYVVSTYEEIVALLHDPR